jgi:hypothetical protein
VKKRGSGICRGIVAAFNGCDNWIKRGSEGGRCYYGMDET